ncbi:hypothetical protein [Mucilaginibacter sp.]|uniref:hypothetical protein n=1 Tax=Mucilaginibacter sp. TaxID=1882438 RepID=UPI0025FE2EEB|nr:hypothetical protein [Mucilaginibacter sp.]
MSILFMEALLQLYRRRKGLIYRRQRDPDFASTLASFELHWLEAMIEKYLDQYDISELTDHLAMCNRKNFKK